jgi:hypothetical protein
VSTQNSNDITAGSIEDNDVVVCCVSVIRSAVACNARAIPARRPFTSFLNSNGSDMFVLTVLGTHECVEQGQDVLDDYPKISLDTTGSQLCLTIAIRYRRDYQLTEGGKIVTQLAPPIAVICHGKDSCARGCTAQLTETISGSFNCYPAYSSGCAGERPTCYVIKRTLPKGSCTAVNKRQHKRTLPLICSDYTLFG